MKIYDELEIDIIFSPDVITTSGEGGSKPGITLPDQEFEGLL